MKNSIILLLLCLVAQVASGQDRYWRETNDYIGQRIAQRISQRINTHVNRRVNRQIDRTINLYLNNNIDHPVVRIPREQRGNWRVRNVDGDQLRRNIRTQIRQAFRKNDMRIHHRARHDE